MTWVLPQKPTLPQARFGPALWQPLDSVDPIIDVRRVTVWHAAVGMPPEGVLTPDEEARAARFKSAATRVQFRFCRAFLRLVLGRLLGQPPTGVGIVIGPDGKPFVAGHPVHFNLTHTAELVLVATGPVPLGVDVERVRPVENASGLVRRYFSEPEQAEFAALPESVKLAAFFRGWTHKEAVLKGIGCGVRELGRAQVRLDPRTPPTILAPAETVRDWELAAWQPSPGAVAALAVSLR